MTPTQAYRRVASRVPPRLPTGLDARVNGAVGYFRRRPGLLRDLLGRAEEVDGFAPQYKELTDHQLQERLLGFREQFRRGGSKVGAVLHPALAAVREAADRKLGLRPFVVQLAGALALHRGCLAEMATGEGKTLTAGLAAVLAGWSRRPCHIVTVNDYLVERDAAWMRPLDEFCGIRTGTVTAPLDVRQRTHGYDADVTYVTSKELLADFLRDRLRLGPQSAPARRLIREILRPRAGVVQGVVMRGLHTAIVDEADSVLIDEAVTPLIISAPQKNEMLHEAVAVADGIAAGLEPELDYTTSLRYREVELTQRGRERVAAACSALPGLWRGSERRDELIRQALVARVYFQRDTQYVIDQGKIVIVDEFTGRQMPQRTWRQGLHQAIEAKEGLPISDPSETVARLSFQRFFRCFQRFSGMTGTAREAAGEFWQVYRLPVVTIPTNRPCIREQRPDRLFADEASKWEAIVEEIERLHATRRPILVGTRSVAASEKLGTMLFTRGLNFKLLNAVRHQEEALTIAVAGEAGRITIATNMAGRGTDIKLGAGVAAMGGLHVMATERHESGRVDRQLFGRSARQGDPGSAQAFVSVEDELLRRHLPERSREAVAWALRSRLPGWERLGRAACAAAQWRAQAQAFKQRGGVLRADTWLEDALSFSGEQGGGWSP